jgi:hypothetical protein
MSESQLSAPLQALAAQYLLARQQYGDALLALGAIVAAAFATAATSTEWEGFLHAAQIAPETAERLLSVYQMAGKQPDGATVTAGTAVDGLLAAPPTLPNETLANALGAPSSDFAEADLDADMRVATLAHPVPPTGAEPNIEQIHSHLQSMKGLFRDVKGRLTTQQFLEWARAELQMDAATALDFVAYYAGGGLTDRMLAYLDHSGD